MSAAADAPRAQVTIFSKANCPYCDRVQACLTRLLAIVNDEGSTIALRIINCTKNTARAPQCASLSGSATVPQVFFNAEHVGDADCLLALERGGGGCENALLLKLRRLAAGPPLAAPFPPPTPAAVLKVTEELAFSSQPTIEQVDQLAGFGFAGLVNLLPEGDFDADAREPRRARALGLDYARVPCAAVGRASVGRALSALARVKKPALVHDAGGRRACLFVLLRAAQQLTRQAAAGGAKPAPDAAQVLAWGRDLGHEYSVHRELIMGQLAAWAGDETERAKNELAALTERERELESEVAKRAAILESIEGS